MRYAKLKSTESVLATFFDIEKAYDMLWKEGLLIKLKRMEISGKMFNWIEDFLKDRTVEVWVGSESSSTCTIENGTPQGSECSPILFNIMINYVFSGVDQRISRALYADDEAFWARGRNIDSLQHRMQTAISQIEMWSFDLGVPPLSEQTQVICSSKKRIKPILDLKIYGQSSRSMN